VTAYRLVHHPERGLFGSVTAAVAYALLNDLNPKWEAVRT
jgi:hypothetical protein